MFAYKLWHNCTIGSKMWGLPETGAAAIFSEEITAYHGHLCNKWHLNIAIN